ncbi:hypothetical protein CPB83DRAFT_862672 [Crepidotus variabilis]|uniref:Coiled-coil domain-containing protein 16 n=1 Tax=Crepidotus variabilis TaxID=179855 RepID=A0A9P6JK53_9AGAR|nr:hypothetical protein CPB83DRAFT_862672 [Crepidotus variabilis]
MTDVRALLKAKRQEARINHPYASYNGSGQLKCSICTTIVKHASAWEGHLGSKAHRTNVIRKREEEMRQEEMRQQQASRQDDEDEDEAMEDVGEPETAVAGNNQTAGKRKAALEESSIDQAGKKQKVEKPSSGFPSDFFSDPSRAPVLSDRSDEEDEHATNEPTKPAPQTDIDLEYDNFQREILGPLTTDLKEAYDRATVFAEPVVTSSNNTTGFPPTDEAAVEVASAPTEEELRRNREEEEKELIMDRLLEEERAQEDADTRVLLLKNKIELMRQKKREAKVKKG